MATETEVVALIGQDHLEQPISEASYIGKEFHLEAMLRWWKAQNSGEPLSDEDFDITTTECVGFRLYDDDNELYYTGWLLNDPGCYVQMFVLAWATADSGCTRIEVKKNGRWTTEIG